MAKPVKRKTAQRRHPATAARSALTIPLKAEAARALRRQVPRRDIPEFIARAVEQQLQHERLGAFIKELEEKIGPADPADVAEAKALWLSL